MNHLHGTRTLMGIMSMHQPDHAHMHLVDAMQLCIVCVNRMLQGGD